MSKIGHVTGADTSWQTVASEVSLYGKPPPHRIRQPDTCLMNAWWRQGFIWGNEGVITELSLPSTLPCARSCLPVRGHFQSLWIDFILWKGLKWITKLSQNAIILYLSAEYFVLAVSKYSQFPFQKTNYADHLSDSHLNQNLHRRHTTPESSCHAASFYHTHPILHWRFSLAHIYQHHRVLSHLPRPRELYEHSFLLQPLLTPYFRSKRRDQSRQERLSFQSREVCEMVGVSGENEERWDLAAPHDQRMDPADGYYILKVCCLNEHQGQRLWYPWWSVHSCLLMISVR